jgi:hypothetical protein
MLDVGCWMWEVGGGRWEVGGGRWEVWHKKKPGSPYWDLPGFLGWVAG